MGSTILGVRRVARYLDLAPGTWVKMADGTPTISCGGCGERGSLADHTIATDGTVSPSLVCPADCGWHVFGRLLDWPGEE